jgi:hypothetical protein
MKQAAFPVAAVDSAQQVIVACEVINQPIDKGQAVSTMKQDGNNTRQLPREMSANAGYFSTKAVEEMRPWRWKLSSHRVRFGTQLFCHWHPAGVFLKG